MDTKTSDWRPGPSVCRCCLTEGCYKDISTEYFWMGKKEVYSEMLSDTFSISIAYSQSGGPNSNSRLICEPCIARLRDASDFRRQVVECEKTFMQHLDPGTSSSLVIETHPENMECEVKLERVKLEKRLSDDELDDPDFLDDDDDDMDDEPLTKLASKVPKKESVDLLDLLDNSKSALKRKSTTKTKASPAKKSKTKKEPAKAASSKATKPEKKKKDVMGPLASVARRNAEIIVKYTTAYPFGLPESTVICAYCYQTYPDPNMFREHMDVEHKTFKVEAAFVYSKDSMYLKTDCTNLRCRICSESFENLNDIAKHLNDVHDKTISLDADLGVDPFILGIDTNQCGICNKKFPRLKQLSRHIPFHYQNFFCDYCDKSYTTRNGVQQHIKRVHIKGKRICRKCRKTFDSLDAKRKHLLDSTKCWIYKCNLCNMRFMSSSLKEEHLTRVHGKKNKSHACPECEKVFISRSAFCMHFESIHSGIKHQCPKCDRQFTSKKCLRQHSVVHNRMMYQCLFCLKCFRDEAALERHMWIHREGFPCDFCNRVFKNENNFKAHRKTHVEITS